MKASVAAFLSGVLYLFSATGHAWPMAWIAPLPVLWFAFGRASWNHTAIVAGCAYLIGEGFLIAVYRSVLPTGVLFGNVLVMTLIFTLIVLASRFVVHRAGPLGSAFIFPALMVTWELMLARLSPNGSFGSVAYSQVSFLPVIQVASVVGLAGITFVVSLVPSAIAVAVHKPSERKPLALVAGTCLAAVLVFGFFSLSRPEPDRSVLIALVGTDRYPSAFTTEDVELAEAVVADYSARVRTVAGQGAQIVVLPEEIVAVRPAWRERARSQLSSVAREEHVILVAGFRRWEGNVVRNVAEIYPADTRPQEYFKQHLVPGLESSITPGDGTTLVSPQAGVAICKDMDFAELGRNYSRQQAGLMLVPAWDFVKDGWLHASMAILRGVEGGYSVARSAREGLLTATDSRGRMLAPAASSAADKAVIVRVPIGTGDTLYSEIGDLFAYLCALLAIALLLKAVFSSLVEGEPLRQHVAAAERNS